MNKKENEDFDASTIDQKKFGKYSEKLDLRSKGEKKSIFY